MKFFVGAVNLYERDVARELIYRYIRESGLKEEMVFGDEFFASASPHFGDHGAERADHLIVHCEPFEQVSFSSKIADAFGSDASTEPSVEDKLALLYREYSEDWPGMLSSEHVTAVWDRASRRLLISRDRFGTKPLYYSVAGKTLVFSNRLACVLNFPGVSQELSSNSALDFLLFGKHNNFESQLTPFNAIRAVPPAHLLIKSQSNCRLSRYWTFPTSAPAHYMRSSQGILDEFCNLLHNAISRRVGPGNVLVALSGGVDSTTTSSVAMEFDDSLRGRASAFTVADSDQSDEYVIAQRVANKIGLPHQRFDDSVYSLFDCETLCLIPTENPFPQKYIDLLAFSARKADTVLTAGAADNLIVWSDVYLINELRHSGPFHAIRSALYYKKMFARRISWRAGTARTDGTPTYSIPDWVRESHWSVGKTRERWEEFWTRAPEQPHSRHPQAHLAMTCVNWDRDLGLADFQADTSNRVDPFLDEDLISFVLSLPVLPWFYQKRLIKGLGSRYLPPEVLKRKKAPAKDLARDALRNANLVCLNKVLDDELLTELVDLTKWDPISPSQSPAARYVNWRLVALSRWLTQIRSSLN